jgi:DNA-binding transcriptional LysR family regulator
MLDLHRLRVFRAVVASGSVNAAAANLGYTPSAVSQHVTALQRETGLTLFARSGRGIEPTAVGLTLAGEIDGVLTQLGSVETLVAELRDGRTGSLSIAYFASVGAAWMPAVARDLLRDFPDLRLTLQLQDDSLTPAGKRPDLQLVVAPPGFSGTRQAHARHLHDDPYVAVVHEEHPFSGLAEVELARLAAERWIDNDFARGWCRENLLAACRSAGFSPAFAVEAHDYPMALSLVAAGAGITVLPRVGALRLPPETRAVPLIAPTPVRSIFALVQTSSAQTPPVRRALALLEAAAA